MQVDLVELGRRLAARSSGRSEADLKADVRTLLLYGGLNLEDSDLQEVHLEAATDSGFIDIEAGSCVIEAKRRLTSDAVRQRAEEQLARYLDERTRATGTRYVGLLTDGSDWLLYRLQGTQVLEVARLTLTEGRVDRLIAWLEAVLATTQAVVPTPGVIVARLGAESPGHRLDAADLAGLYAEARDLPSVKLKRELWAKLLQTALGTQFDDTDELFVQHTLLVLEAETIAHAVLGIEVAALTPGQLVAGDQFRAAGVSGVVEHDFFDWPLDATGGARFLSQLARRLGRFDWSAVEHDVMKVLYEATIPAEQRKQLGEYYTPDWLAQRMVETVVTDPLGQRVLDPACGSGTFLFHAVRRYLDAAETNLSSAQALEGLADHVLGLDLHPVAVTLARVTYLLAIGTDRLTDPHRPALHVPVYLGDSMQWTQETNALTAGWLVVPTEDGFQLFADELRFPGELLDHTGRFDQLVARLADLARDRKSHTAPPSIKGVLESFGVPTRHHATLGSTFAVMCHLHDDERDHIWGYYVRNLARPLWLADAANQVDVLVGNPPWLAHQYMPADMQTTFSTMAKQRSLWPKGGRARAFELAALFVARCMELYLRDDGHFAFVMPRSTLSRRQYAGFREGRYTSHARPVSVEFEPAWDLKDIRPEPFPVPACVMHGKAARTARAFDGSTIRWHGSVSAGNASWAEVASNVATEEATVVAVSSDYLSPYEPRFRNGAILYPRLLIGVENEPTGSRLGAAAGTRPIRSRRSADEKKPWRDLDSLHGVVEEMFIRPMLLGETITSFRCREPWLAVIPADASGLLSLDDDRISRYQGLEAWWHDAEAVWETNRKTSSKPETQALAQRLDYHGQLSAQLAALPTPNRIVYSASAGKLVAARVEDPRAIVEHKLYWAATWAPEEALYLCSVLNSPETQRRVQPLQSIGKFGPRDIDKAVFLLPIPEYDEHEALHADLVELARRAEDIAAGVEISPTTRTRQARAAVAQALEASGVSEALEQAVATLFAS